MNKPEAIEHITEIMHTAGAAYGHGSDNVTLVLERPLSYSPGKSMRLMGRSSPLGHVMCYSGMQEGRSRWAVSFPVVSVMAWCAARLEEFGVGVIVRVA